MSLSAEVLNDWTCPYPFRLCHLSSEHDTQLGQWEFSIVLLGIGLCATWVFNPHTELRKELADMMADESWLKASRVTMSYPDYEKMRDAAAKWEASQ